MLAVSLILPGYDLDKPYKAFRPLNYQGEPPLKTFILEVFPGSFIKSLVKTSHLYVLEVRFQVLTPPIHFH